MGLIRRVALDELGGWDEWVITEDAELSLRLLRAGWHGLHVDETFGRGIMPLTFEALKGQRYRWCFGGIQILRMHWRSMMPGRHNRANRLTAGQRWAYLAGAAQWYGDLLSLLFFIFLLAGAVNLTTGGGQLFRKLTLYLVSAIPVMVLLGLVRAIALLRRGTGASWRDALGAFFIWQSTSLVVARASVLALFAKKAAFLREAIRVTGSPGTVHLADIGDTVERFAGAVDCVTARAVAPLHQLVGFAEPLVRRGAKALFLKGQDVEAELTEATKYWNIEPRLHSSRTGGHGWIVELDRIERRNSSAITDGDRA